MTTLREAAQQALEALETLVPTKGPSVHNSARDALRAALAEPVQEPVEPVALPCCGYTDASAIKWNPYNQVVQCHNCGQTYTAPPQRKPLTEGEIDKIFKHLCNTVGASYKTMTRAVERAHGIKE